MKRQPFCNFLLCGMSITEFGLEIPSPFVSLELSNSEITSFTSWELTCIVGGDASKKVNIAAFEALLYSAAQDTNKYHNASGIPVSFAFGWLDESGNVAEHATYQGFTLKFSVSTSGLYMTYNIQGFASLAIQSSMPTLRIPALCGIVQGSAVLEGLAKALRIPDYYDLDIDHCDAPTLINHGPLTTSFNRYVRGVYNGRDNYDDFPGLLKYSKSYNGTRDSAGLSPLVRSLRQVVDNVKDRISDFLIQSFTDNTAQCSSFSYWVDEPTTTRRGIIHYKSNAGLLTSWASDVLEYGTANTNILSLNGSYDGVAYNMTNMRFASTGFALDGSGNTIVQNAEVVNSWSSSLADVFQTVDIINDVNAIASQFSGNFNIDIPGNVRSYSVAQPISLLVMSGNTISPITGVYNIISVSHKISSTFVTSLKVQRLVMSSANSVASMQGIFIAGSGNYPTNSYTPTSNVISTNKVDFGTLYPDFSDLYPQWVLF